MQKTSSNTMQLLCFQLILVFLLTNSWSTEAVTKCYGCIAGPSLVTIEDYDQRCKSGKLSSSYQYTCHYRNSKNSNTSEFLNTSEITKQPENHDMSPENYLVCAAVTFTGNGSELFTVRSCIYDEYKELEDSKDIPVCQQHSDLKMLLKTLKPNPLNMGNVNTLESYFPNDVEIVANLCTCSNDACNSSNKLYFKFSNLFLIIFCFIAKLGCV